jgi:hypothetical protein
VYLAISAYDALDPVVEPDGLILDRMLPDGGGEAVLRKVGMRTRALISRAANLYGLDGGGEGDYAPTSRPVGTPTCPTPTLRHAAVPSPTEPAAMTAPANRMFPSPHPRDHNPAPGPSYCIVGETLCRVCVWTEEEWATLDPARRPATARHVPGLGWVGAVPSSLK